ncbi:rhodanese-like domain-containing protein [Thermodesulfobacteriota bacterium]
MKKIVTPALFFLLLGAATVWAHSDVTPREAKALIDENPELVVVDVREISEYCEGHISDALNYPWSSKVLQSSYEELDVDSEILVVCQSGGRSAAAALFLDDKGFLNVYDMEGGMGAWEGDTAACADTDGDGVYDVEDNCPEVSNPEQTDADNDGLGDVCEPDCPATAALGADDPRLATLRQFRDEVLSAVPSGRRLVAAYYRNAEAAGALLEQSPVLKAVARQAITCLVPVLQLMVSRE